MPISNQTRLLVLGSMDEFVDLVNRAKSRGIYTVVCDGYKDGPAKAVADAAFTIDVRDTAAIAKLCRDEAIDAITASFSDVLAEAMIDVADALNLPAYVTPEKMAYVREKPLMKKMFSDLNIPSPTSQEATPETVHEVVQQVGFPCVIKPVSGYGSHGVHVITAPHEIAELSADTFAHSKTPAALVEPYNTGREFNMMTWVLDGRVYLLSIADREKTTYKAGEVPHVSRIVYPSKYVDEVAQDALSIAQRIADYLGFTTGPLCIQFFSDDNGTIEVCEAAGRIFGYEHELLPYAGGPAIEELLLDSLFDKETLRQTLEAHDVHLPKLAAGLYFHGEEGTVAQTQGCDDAATFSGVVEYLPYVSAKESISHGAGAKPYAARYYIQADNRKELDQLTQSIYTNASMKSADGKELLYPNRL